MEMCVLSQQIQEPAIVKNEQTLMTKQDSSSQKSKKNKLKKALKNWTELKRKLNSCLKLLKNCQVKKEDEFITLYDIFGNCGAFKSEEGNIQNAIDRNDEYADPIRNTIIHIFESKEKVTVKEVKTVLEKEYEEMEMNYCDVTDEIADLVGRNTYENIQLDDNEYLHDYMNPSEIDQIIKASIERKMIQTGKSRVQNISQTLNTLPVEDNCEIQNQFKMQDGERTSKIIKIMDKMTKNVEEETNELEKLDGAVANEQVEQDIFVDQKHCKVRDVAFEINTEELIESQDKSISQKTRVKDEETKQPQKGLEENEVHMDEMNNNDSQIYEPLTNIHTELDKFLKELKQVNSDAVFLLEDMKVTLRKGTMNIEPDEATKEIIWQKYGKVGEISITELTDVLNDELKAGEVIQDVSNYASLTETCIAAENLSDETNPKYMTLLFDQNDENELVYENCNYENELVYENLQFNHS